MIVGAERLACPLATGRTHFGSQSEAQTRAPLQNPSWDCAASKFHDSWSRMVDGRVDVQEDTACLGSRSSHALSVEMTAPRSHLPRMVEPWILPGENDFGAW
jgi:hypothetical protein